MMKDRPRDPEDARERPLNREEKARDIKAKILSIAYELFIAQGYKKTTIRQITERAGVLTGSLYHFFRDKEDILLLIVIDVYDTIMEKAGEIIGTETDPALKYALIYALEMKSVEKYDRVAELYYESYNSWRITEMLVKMNAARNREFFHRYNKGFTDRDYHLRTLALRGMRLSFIAERFFSGNIDFNAKIPFLIETGLGMFNVPASRIKPAIDRAMATVKDDRYTLRGFRI